MKKNAETGAQNTVQHTGCPGNRMQRFERTDHASNALPSVEHAASQLGQWPCQIKLVPVNAPYFDGAKLLIAADCTAFAYANLHQEFMKGKITLIGCPKLDSIDYSEKLTEYSCVGVPLFRRNGYRQSGGRKPLFRNRDTALN